MSAIAALAITAPTEDSRKMANKETRKSNDSDFSFGAGVVRQAQGVPRQAPRRVPASEWEITIQTEKPSRDSRGNDPYNTSGSFDRSRNWARVGKR
jgi:hypothetical protein